MAVIVKQTASNKPKHFVGRIRQDSRIVSNSAQDFEKLVVACVGTAKASSMEDVPYMHVWLSKVGIAKLLQKIAGQSESHAFDLLTQNQREAGTSTGIVIEKIHPSIDRIAAAQREDGSAASPQAA